MTKSKLTTITNSKEAVRILRSGGKIRNHLFEGCTFTDLYLKKLRIQDCLFVRCVFTRVVFANSTLRAILIDTSAFQEVRFASGLLEDSSFSDSKLQTCTFESIFLEEVEFDGCEIENLKFLYVGLKDIAFPDCTINGIHFRKGRWERVSFSKASNIEGLTTESVTSKPARRSDHAYSEPGELEHQSFSHIPQLACRSEGSFYGLN